MMCWTFEIFGKVAALPGAKKVAEADTGYEDQQADNLALTRHSRALISSNCKTESKSPGQVPGLSLFVRLFVSFA